ncbi:MAG: hypothetical protein [Caudoviricetes sp.]|nr:MAG: hypothetical protein [Caudoviricetes sp.]
MLTEGQAMQLRNAIKSLVMAREDVSKSQLNGDKFAVQYHLRTIADNYESKLDVLIDTLSEQNYG